MQMFNESILCGQSIELFRHKLWYKLNSPHMHYLYTSYKIAKLDKQTFCSKVIFCLSPLHAHAQYICIVYAKYQKASVKALGIQVDFSCHFVKNYFFLHKTSSCKCSMCLYYVGKVSDSFSKSSGTS